MNLYPYQVAGAAWLGARRRALLADQMGLGKTVQALAAIPKGAPVLVVCPKVVKPVWLAEAERFRPDIALTACLQGGGSFRWPAPGELVVTNYDVLHETVTDAPPGCVLIADEAHALKSARAKRTKRFRLISQAVGRADGRVWLLTGTPLLNRPPELWGVLQSAGLARTVFGSWPTFLRLFHAVPARFGGFHWGKPEPSVPQLLGRAMLARRRSAVLPDLPVKTYRTIPCEIDDGTRAACDALVKDCEARSIDLDDALEVALETKAQAPIFEELSRLRERLAVAKLPALYALLEEYEEAGEPLVVFSRHLAPVELLSHRDGWGAIHGGRSDAERRAVVDAFQRGELKGIAATIQAGGVGITLTRAAHVVFLDLDWTPALNEQAEDRICRIGQTRGCQVTRLVADHRIDARVTQLLGAKQRLIAATVEAAAPCDGTLPDVLPVVTPAQAPRNNGAGPVTDAPHVSCSGAPSRFRPANSATEAWAATAIRVLASCDTDHARERNGVGFNQSDGVIGHSLAEQLDRGGRLSDKQWAAVVRIASRYPRQVGPKPDGATCTPTS